MYKILKASENITTNLTPAMVKNARPSENLISKNLNISVYAFIIQCFWNLLVSLYERRRKRQYRQSHRYPNMIGYDMLPKSRWTNDFPIVLVHGYAGWAPEEGPFWGDYWSYLSDPEVAEHHMIF